MKTTPDNRAAWAALAADDDYEFPAGVVKALLADLEEAEAKRLLAQDSLNTSRSRYDALESALTATRQQLAEAAEFCAGAQAYAIALTKAWLPYIPTSVVSDESISPNYGSALQSAIDAAVEPLRKLLTEARQYVVLHSPSGKPFDFPKELVDKIDDTLAAKEADRG